MAFKMNDKTFTSMLAVAKELGKARIYRKDFDKYGIVEVDETATKEVTKEVVAEVKVEEKPEVKETPEVIEVENKEPEVIEEPEVKEEPKPEVTPEPKTGRTKMSDEEKKEKRAERRAKRRDKKREEREEANKPTPEMLAKAKELQDKSGYTEIWDWAVDMKKRTAEEVFEIAEGLGLKWERHATPKIDRMRAVMLLRESLFPGQKRPRVRKSNWTGVPNEKIAELATKHNVTYPQTADEKITRMHMIKALKDAGIKSPE